MQAYASSSSGSCIWATLPLQRSRGELAALRTEAGIYSEELRLSEPGPHPNSLSHQVTCAQSALPSLTITSSNTATLSAVDLLMPWSVASSNTALYRVPIRVSQPVIVFAQSEYDFPVDQLQLVLYQNGVKSVIGKPGDHFNQLNSLVQPGSYELVVEQVGYSVVPHCIASSLRIFVRPPTDGLVFQDCSSQLTAPYDLTTTQGGGPIDSYGSLSLYGEYLLVDNHPFDIFSTIELPSLMSVYVRSLEAQLGTYVSLSSEPSGASVTPVYHPHHSFVNWNSYELAPGNYSNDIRIDIATSWGQCPSFVLHIEIDSKAHLANLLSCQSNEDVITFSPTDLVVSENGFGSKSYSGKVPLSRLQSATPIELYLNVSQSSTIQTSVSFNSLVSDFDVRYRSIDASAETSPFTMIYALDQKATSAIPDLQRWSSFTVYTDHPTTYVLRLLPTTFSTSLGVEAAHGLCLPVTWDVLVAPRNAVTPYVAAVMPTRGVDLPLYSPLTLDINLHNAYSIVALNDGLFSAATPADIQTAFVLQSKDAPEQMLIADGAAVDNSRCVLIFSADSLYTFITTNAVDSRTLELVLIPRRLYNGDEAEIILVDEHIYTFVDPLCSHHGQLDATGQCACDAGYARQSCQICQVGYHFIDSNTLCVPDGSTERCSNASCWGHGTCDDSTGHIRCACNPGYAQPDCGSCVSPLVLDPLTKECVERSSCAADTCHTHGACDDATGIAVCSCDEGYLEPYCQYCATGYLLNPNTQECVPTPQCDFSTCSGHGTCHEPDADSSSLDLICVCNPGYSGPRCSECGMHFEPCVQGCCPESPCTDSTCSGHGVCDDTSGLSSCTCTENRYALPACDKCSTGYINYPACTPSTQPSLLCNAPVLPTSLDEIGFLIDDGDVHLQGHYYMDLSSQAHEITFSLSMTSGFRAYVEPYSVDVDLFLFEVLPTGLNSLIEMSIDSHTEEDIFTVLTVPEGETKLYLFRLSYLIWSDPSLQLASLDTLCKTFNFELAISPAELVQYLEYLYTDSPCTLTLPSLPTAEGGHLITEDFHYLNYSGFQIPAPADTNSAFFFWSWQFQVPESFTAEGKFVTLSAEVGYQFLPGQIALLLQSDAQDGQPHCGHGENPSISTNKCFIGRNYLNRQILTSAVAAGTYTLWLYQPTPSRSDLVSCAHFDLRLDLTVSQLPTTLYSCDLVPLPANLNQMPGHFEADGSVHIFDRFLFSATRSTAFTLTDPSVFTFSSSSPVASAVDASFELTNSQLDSLGSIPLGSAGSLVLPAGSYSLTLSIHGVSGDALTNDFCSPLLVDLAIVPQSLIVTAQPCQAPLLPAFSRQQLSAPYVFDLATDFCASATGNANVFTFDVVVRSTPTLLKARLDTASFSGLQLSIKKKAAGTLISQSTSNFNRQALTLVLQPDSVNSLLVYTVSVDWVWGKTLADSAPFNFYLSLTAVDDTTSTSLCLTGEDVPSVLPALRYQTSPDDKTFHFFSNLFLVPSASSKTIEIRPADISTAADLVFRIHLENTDTLSISCALFETSSGTPHLVLSGNTTGLGREDVHTAVLSPTDLYSLVLTFTPTASLPPCSYFAMGLELQLETAVSNLQCANSLPPSVIPPDGYDSVELGDELYFARGGNTALTYSMQFTRTEPFDIHSEVFSEFLTGDIGLQLLSSSGTLLATAVSHFTSRSLSLTDVPAGHYFLRLYEPSAFPSGLPGCTHFSFSVIFDSGTLQSAINSPFSSAISSAWPSTLNRIPFLAYDENSVFVDQFSIRHSVPTSVAFSLEAASILRFAALPQDTGIDVAVSLTGGSLASPYTPTPSNLYVRSTEFSRTLDPGDYVLTLTPGQRSGASARSPQSDYTAVTVSLAIMPSSQYTAIINYLQSEYPANCPDTPDVDLALDPSGFALYNADWVALSDTSSRFRVSITTEFATAIFAQVSFCFPMNDLYLALVASTSTSPLVPISGNEGVYQLNTVVPAGDYYLEVRPLTSDPPPAHCRVFSLRIITSDASSSAPNSQCSSYDVLPWNLNTDDGGSAAYGGPMANDRLDLYGGHFLIATQSSLVTTQVIAAHFDSPSYISIFIRGVDQAYWRQVTASIQPTGGANVSNTPYLSATTQKSQLVSHLVPAGNAQIALRLQLASVTFHLPCLSYELAIMVRSTELLSSSFMCIADVNAVDLATQDIAIDSQGFAITAVDSFFLDPMTTSQTYLVPIQDTAAPSFFSFEASIMFNSLGSNVQLDVVSIDNGQQTVIASSVLDAVPDFNAGGFDVITSVTRVLSKNMRNLHLRVTVTGIANTFGHPLCIPFCFRAATFPYPSTSFLIVQSVTPADAQYLAPAKHLSLTVQFNQDDLYAADQSVLSPLAVRNAFSLVEQCSCASPRVFHPHSVEGTGMAWSLVFSELPPAATFLLSLQSNSIFLSDHTTAALLLANHSYHVIDPTCNSHGSFHEQGYCACDPGYAQPECNACAYGFEAISGAGPTLICQRTAVSSTTATTATTTSTIRTTTTTTPPRTTRSTTTRTTTTKTTTTTTSLRSGCRDDSCGCVNSNNATACEPIGECLSVNEATGVATCECPEGFDVSKQCRACSEGYIDFPTCYLNPDSCLALCQHGGCQVNNVTQITECICTDGWMGKQCDQVDTCSTTCIENQGTCTKNERTGLLACVCNPGYSGKHCDAVAKKISLAAVIGIILAAIFLLMHIVFFAWWAIKRARRERQYSPVLDLDDNTGIPSDSSDDDPFAPSTSSHTQLRFSSDDDLALHLTQPEPTVLDLQGGRERLADASDDDLFSGL